MVMRRLLLALFTALAFAVVVEAQDALVERRIGLTWDHGVPRISVSVRDLVDANARRALASGLGEQLVVTVQAYRAGQSVPLATRVLSCRVTYDLWEESYVVRRGRRTDVVRGADEAISLCLALDRIAVGDAATFAPLHGAPIYFAVRAEFNPISASRCPRLLRNPAGDDPLVPVVVNIVRREICQAERSIEFRSAQVQVP